MSIVSELKRRNVVRVALLYGVVAWVILQVAEVLFGVLALPAWTSKFVFGLLVLGFPLALIFSWVYELTPEGLKREHEVDRNASITRETGRKINYLIGALAAIAIVMMIGQRFAPRTTPIAAATQASARPTQPTVQAAAKSIAVLPFVDMSAAKDQEYFADGLSEELLNLLAKVPELRVAARTSAFKFKGERVDLQDVAKQLNVAHVLEGSVRRSGNKVRITAQLIKASDGYHVWSQTYDRTFDDIFAVQDDIAGEVVKALKVSLLGTTSATRSRPVDPEAYNLVLQGRFFLQRRGKEDIAKAVDYFQRATERDPGYAPAWSGLSQAYARQADSGFVPTAGGFERAREAAEKALALDPRLADAHVAMGEVQLSFDWDWTAADASLRRALDLEPGNSEALRRLSGVAATAGRWNEAIDLANKAIERDPLRPNSWNNLGLTLLAVNRDTEAETAFRKAMDIDPDGAARHQSLAQALLLQGKTEAALQEVQLEKNDIWRLYGLALTNARGRRSESDAALKALEAQYAGEAAYQIASAHAYRGDADLAFAWLDRAYDQRDPGATEIKGDRFMRGIIGDPRYKAFLRKLKLPD
ncbi:tetratricopeptide repeat protein [Lysobacter sp. KIS68-7]|uniref:tetratricopeptide repeat protein n=1 Tax=Lysobacter sp. KIS68-7 TaxID=2904252 RepID=UPI001E50FF00|nr:tetratricopeptide repeat protein [Lysobacter sp. KIS68-7]UHQ18554.1 tetratricopeptide repeat protein [Lysobacter sp. KIS68-7]